MLITNEAGKIFRDKFIDLASSSKEIIIAAGYFGASEIRDRKKLLLDVVKKGGNVKLIHGLQSWEGVHKTTAKTMLDLDYDLRLLSKDSGFYFNTKQRFHGKIYYFDDGKSQTCIIGSSNFSETGFLTYLEANLLQVDKSGCKKALDFLNNLLKTSNICSLKTVKLKSSGSVKKLKPKSLYKLPSNIKTMPVDFTLPIRCMPKSNINLTFSSGRLNRKTGIYTTRPYYEMEITVKKQDWIKPLTNFVPNQTKPVEFEIYTDNNLYFEALFKSKKKGTPMHQTTIDFMSSPRRELGHFIKDKLISNGIINYGDFITNDNLTDYGNSELRFKKLNGNRFYIEF